ncbi:hypothetical protein [Occultella aeris]|nr:hypothetical protein [Occultella aeris]
MVGTRGAEDGNTALGQPRVVALSYYALGPNAQQQARDDLGH